MIRGLCVLSLLCLYVVLGQSSLSIGDNAPVRARTADVERPQVDDWDISVYEEILTAVMTQSEFEEERKLLCDKFESYYERSSKGSDKFIYAKCKVSTGSFWIQYDRVGTVFSISDEDGSIIADNGSNGVIDYARTKNKENEYINFPKMKVLTGAEHKARWQELFNQRIESIFRKLPRLKEGEIFHYLY